MKKLKKAHAEKKKNHELKDLVRDFVGQIIYRPRVWSSLPRTKIDHMFPSDLFAMLLIWLEITEQQEKRPSYREERFASCLEDILPEFGIDCYRLESQNAYNLDKGLFRFKFKKFRLSLLGMEILNGLYRKANKN